MGANNPKQRRCALRKVVRYAIILSTLSKICSSAKKGLNSGETIGILCCFTVFAGPRSA